MAYTPQTGNVVSKVNVNGVDYLIKDAHVEEEVALLKAAAKKDVVTTISMSADLPTAEAVKSYVDQQVGAINNFDVVIDSAGTADGPSVTATTDTMYKLYLVPDVNAEAGAYVEWITLHSENAYSWEAIGSTKTNLADYLTNVKYVADSHKLQQTKNGATTDVHTFGAFADKSNASGTVASQTVKNVKATGQSAGSIDVVLAQTATSAVLTKADYTPAGSVAGTVTPTGTVAATAHSGGGTAGYTPTGTITKPTITVTPATVTVKEISNVGTLPTFSQTSGAFATAGVVVTAPANNDETIKITAAATANAVKTATFSAGTLPTSANKTVVSGISSATASTPTFSGVGVDLSFTGNSNNISATFTGAKETGLKVTDAKYDKASVNADSTKFNPAAITLSVGDIVVPSQTVTVS